MFDALDIQDKLQTLYTSGTVFHAFLGEKLPDWKSTAKLVKTIADNYELPYYTMSPTYSVCAEHGYLVGEQFTCPHCGKETEVYSRITGYYRPVKNWNDGKSQEYKNRREYVIGKTPVEAEAACTTCQVNVDEQTEEKQANVETKAGLILLTTKTCPNCSIVKEALKKAGIEYTELYADENIDFCREHQVMTAPTLFVPTDNGYEKHVNASNVIKYLNTL